MPLDIFRITSEGQDNEEIACLCDSNWQLHEMVDALEAWLIENGSNHQPNDYRAIISYSIESEDPVDAVIFTPAMLKTMADLGMGLCLVKYPNANED